MDAKKALTLLVLVLAIGFAPAPARSQDPAAKSPAAAAVAAAKKAFEDARAASSVALGRARSEEERAAIVAAIPRHADLCPKLWRIVREHPRDAGSAEALAWIARYGVEAERLRAAEKLVAEHVDSEFLAEACPGFSTLRPSARGAKILRAMVAGSPHPRVRGTALFHLSSLVGALAAPGPERHREEIELLERVRAEFASVRHGRRGTLGEAADRRLFELRHLRLGATAPEISGKDMDGNPFKLSDYRGRVVLLDFWGHW